MSKYDKELDTRTEEYEEAMQPDPREAAEKREREERQRSDAGSGSENKK